MASEKITVTVKTLSGNLYELNINPQEGLKGVKKALHKFDPSAFPLEFTQIILQDDTDNTDHMNDMDDMDVMDDKKEDTHIKHITPESNLFAIVQQEPKTTLVSVEDKNIDDSYYYNKEKYLIFRLESQKEIHISFYFHSNHMTESGYTASVLDDGTKEMTCYSDNVSASLNTLSKYCSISPRDVFVINGIVQKVCGGIHTPKKQPSWIKYEYTIPIFCDCGHAVHSKKMESHLKTKKHLKGDKKGREFLEKANTYIQSV